MTRIIFYLILILFVSCSHFTNWGRTPNNPELLSYANQFVSESNGKVKSIRNLNIQFVPLDDSKVGVCYMGWNIVYIDPNFWTYISRLRKLELVYHELGHCLCYLGHNDKFLLNGCPASLMYPFHMESHCIHNYWDYYKQELFNKCRGQR